MRPLRTAGLVCGVAHLASIVLLGPLLGSAADPSTAYAEHYAVDANVRRDLVGSLGLLVAAAALGWIVVAARRRAGGPDGGGIGGDLTAAAGLVSAGVIVVAAGVLATVPLTTAIGDLTDDPGIDAEVQAGIAQAGTVVLLVAMVAVGVTTVLLARLGRAAGAVPRWVVVTAWATAGTLLLGASVVLLAPFGAWIAGAGTAWRSEEGRPAGSPSPSPAPGGPPLRATASPPPLVAEVERWLR